MDIFIIISRSCYVLDNTREEYSAENFCQAYSAKNFTVFGRVPRRNFEASGIKATNEPNSKSLDIQSI